jgi:hypothetical protein
MLGGAGILAVLLWRLGTGPFLDGLRMVDGPALAMAFGIGVVTTVCCAWRWSLIADGLGVRLPLPVAVAAYYRSQFLNTTLPGGVIGDVHRSVRHGVAIGDVGLGVRAVVLERVAGQAVQIAIAVAVLFALPSPVRSYLPPVAAMLAGIVLGAVLLGLFARRTGPGVALASAVAVAGHLATFLLSARTAGLTAPLLLLVPLGLLVLLATGVPLNIAGWGPREGAAAWVFGAAGLTAGQGVATAVVYGVLALTASLPGAAMLVVRSSGRVSGGRREVDPPPSGVLTVAQEGVAHG